MNKYHVLTILSIILAIVFLGMSIASNEKAVHLFLIFPVITINSLYSGLGALFVFMTFIFLFLSFISGYEIVGWDEVSQQTRTGPVTKQQTGQAGQSQPSKKINIQGGGVVFIGPIPIIFGSNQKLTLIIAGVALAIMVVAFLFLFN